jgi:hypothetical protein
MRRGRDNGALHVIHHVPPLVTVLSYAQSSVGFRIESNIFDQQSVPIQTKILVHLVHFGSGHPLGQSQHNTQIGPVLSTLSLSATLRRVKQYSSDPEMRPT